MLAILACRESDAAPKPPLALLGLTSYGPAPAVCVLVYGPVRHGVPGLQCASIDSYEAFGQSGHGALRIGRRGGGIVAPLDAVYDEDRSFPRPISGHLAVPVQGHALQSPRPLGLDHIGVPAREVDPKPEAGQVPVPENGVLRFDTADP